MGWRVRTGSVQRAASQCCRRCDVRLGERVSRSKVTPDAGLARDPYGEPRNHFEELRSRYRRDYKLDHHAAVGESMGGSI